jgi:hypothetical protein
LFSFGEVLGKRPFQAEYADNGVYARRVFKTEVCDDSRDNELRPTNFQPFAAVDDMHGYVSENPKLRWWLMRRMRRKQPSRVISLCTQ